MIGKVQEAMQRNAEALKLRGQRQGVLAANIANADTPNYKAQDFDFAAALKQATAGKPLAAPLQQTHTQHLAGNQGALNSLGVRLQFRASSQPSLDGNTVDMDTERAQFADNSLRYEAALRGVNGTINSIRSALQTNG
ncbi:flagellar basal body rod protein FlgB [Parvibium lacunae]|uniref:Flagellar basal body rod protein FlgB n=1 Tax=Parvibium lacunae TaxID=1888893 RepID=A0A368L3N5_9BURK|nr:flagellar basal body rod protein FlgB [Parvibium lacunae]RCS58201.1 flagellar basal body rod protein FlgB [Parvibium lacunae]